MAESDDRLRRFNQAGGRFQTRSARAAMGIRKFTTGLRGFRMEMLSVMFFGLGMSRFFKGLLTPALQLTGVFELFGTVLQILFLPMALLFIDVGLFILDIILGMSDRTKKLIGWFVLIGAALGIFLFIFGQVVLFIGGAILAFGGLFLILDKVGDALFGWIPYFGKSMSSLFALTTSVSILATTTDFLKGIFGGLIDKLLELPIVEELLKKLGVELDENAKLSKKFKDIWAGFKSKLDMVFTFTVAGEALKRPLSWWINFYTVRFKQFISGIIESAKERFDLTSFEEMKTALQTIADLVNTLLGLFERLKGAYEGSLLQGFIKRSKEPSVTFGEGLAGGAAAVASSIQNFISSPVFNIHTTGGVDTITLNQIQETIAREFTSLSRTTG